VNSNSASNTELSHPDQGNISATVPPAAKKALDKVQTRIARYVAQHGTKYTFGSFVDPRTRKIIMTTDAPPNVMSTLTDMSGAPKREVQAIRSMRVYDMTTRNMSRRDDSPPFYGGGGISRRLPGPRYSRCSSGYAVQRAGTRFMVTAGHCAPNGATFRTESLRYRYGTVSDRRLPNATGHPMDMELIGGVTSGMGYAGRIFIGGVDSNTSIPVIRGGPAYPLFYNDYCFSGRSTGESCGHTVLSVDAQSCTETGCVKPAISFFGGSLPRSSDSGSPFYVKDSGRAYIRGHVTASNPLFGYAEPWTTLSAEYGVSIVAGRP
jgi:hypothetical protein